MKRIAIVKCSSIATYLFPICVGDKAYLYGIWKWRIARLTTIAQIPNLDSIPIVPILDSPRIIAKLR